MCPPVCLPNCQLFRTGKKKNYQQLPKYFNEKECKLIMELLMDDGFIFWPRKLNFKTFKTCLNNMLPLTKFTFEKPEMIFENKNKSTSFIFLRCKNNLTQIHLT